MFGKKKPVNNVSVRSNKRVIVNKEPDPNLANAVVKKGFKCNTCGTHYNRMAPALRCSAYHEGK